LVEHDSRTVEITAYETEAARSKSISEGLDRGMLTPDSFHTRDVEIMK
jgi:hypothetical protein